MAINTPKPISRDEKYLSKIGGNEEIIVPKPISREEKYMYRVAGYDDQPIPDYPIGRNEKYWAKIVENGGGSSTLIKKSITENGVYHASDDEADGYSSVEVDVDLNVGSKTITENGTYSASDDELNGYDEVTVNVVGENNCKVERPAGAELFNAKNAIVKVIVPDGYTMISDTSAYVMPYLREIELPSTITKISDSAFTYLMKKIIIHKPEGSISGAPWGARNAEIVWTG